MPSRIISLVPSKTELLYHFGLDEEVIGITKFCVHPKQWHESKTRIGGTKTIDVQKIKTLDPDLIIANKEENVKEQVEALSGFCNVYVSDIKTLEDALQMIEDVGKLVNREGEATKLVSSIGDQFDRLKRFVLETNQTNGQSTNAPLKVWAPGSNQDKDIDHRQQTNTAYLIWKDPYMAAGGDTFINDLMERCGLNNIFRNVARYPEIKIKESTIQLINHSTSDSNRDQPINLSTPDGNRDQLILLSSEPYPFKQKHIDELKAQLSGARILLVDGEMFSWYGSRLLYAAEYFITLLKEINDPN